jgi:CubicO group peptidase (beta-lactamase class C family)
MSNRPPTRAAVVVVLATAAGCAQMARMPSPYLDHIQASGQPASQLDLAMRSFEAQGFSGSVLVAEGSHVLLYRGYGEANRARELRNTAETRFPLGAVENVFTAAALLRLESEGKLSTHDLVSRFVPAPEGLRIDELLSRSREVGSPASGRPTGFGGTSIGGPLAERFTDPGESYITLRKIIERVAGEPYEAYLRRELLEPYGLDRTFWDDGRTEDSLVARGYREPLGETVLAQGLVAPLADLYRWHLALRENQVVPSQSRQRMFVPAPNGYGFGWVVGSTDGGARVFEHAADQPGFQTWMAYFPDKDLIILLGANTDAGWRRPIAERLTDLLVDGVTGQVAGVSQ